MNHFTVGRTDVTNFAFSAIDAADLSAAPIFCVAASENASSVSGAMHIMMVAQLLGFQWYLDFAGFVDNPSSDDPFLRALGVFKSRLQASAYGDPSALMMAGQCIQLLVMLVSCLASLGFNVGFLRSNRPKAAPKHVIEKLD